MGGGLMQLVAYGAQDVYLTGNPQITFWKKSWKAIGLYYMDMYRIKPLVFHTIIKIFYNLNNSHL